MKRAQSRHVLATMLCIIGFISALSRGACAADTVAQALSSDQAEPISANPGATNIIPGSGLLGRLGGLDASTGVRVGGLWIGDADYLLTGGVKPRTCSLN